MDAGCWVPAGSLTLPTPFPNRCLPGHAPRIHEPIPPTQDSPVAFADTGNLPARPATHCTFQEESTASTLQVEASRNGLGLRSWGRPDPGDVDSPRRALQHPAPGEPGGGQPDSRTIPSGHRTASNPRLADRGSPGPVCSSSSGGRSGPGCARHCRRTCREAIQNHGYQPCSRWTHNPASCQDDQRKMRRISHCSQGGRRGPSGGGTI